MRNNLAFGFFLIGYICIFFFPSFAMEHKQQKLKSLNDIKNFTKKEVKEIELRYKTEHDQLFSVEDLYQIESKQLTYIIAETIIHPIIRLQDAESLIVFADEIKNSGLNITELEARLIKYLSAGELVFSALRKAIKRSSFHKWKVSQINMVNEKNDKLTRRLSALALSEKDYQKVINAYAVCINSFRDKNARYKILKPKICAPLDKYRKPRYKKHGISVREDLMGQANSQVLAYNYLIDEAKKVAQKNNLDTFEKVIMAKCISEQSLQFFPPEHHPIRALKKTCAMDRKSPAEVFFMNSGVCGNFSGLTYIIANAVGLTGKIFLAKNNFHIYLEFEENGTWYHIHPFNSKSGCDIIRFHKNKL
jgi:hypothetical protein